MKTPNDYPQIKFRPGSKLEQELALRSDSQTNSDYSQTAKQDLSDYYTLLSLALPAFNKQERFILFQALNGWIATPQTAHLLWAEADSLLETSSLEIDRSAFVGRLQKLSRFECWSILDAIKRGALFQLEGSTATYHYVEPLSSEPIESNEFLVRCVKRQTDGGRMRLNIALEGNRQLTSVRIDFNGRFNLAFAGHALFDLREWLTTQGMSWDSIDLSADVSLGAVHIKESQLAAFEFDAAHGHMLHKRGEIGRRQR